MEAIAIDITFVLCPNILGTLGLAILLVFTRSNFYLEKKKLRLFKLAAIVNLAVIFFEVADYLLGETAFPSAFIFRRVTSAIGFALSPVFPLLISCIAAKNKLPRWSNYPAAANVLMSFCSMFTGHMFLIDSCNSYIRGPLFYVMLLISVFYLALLIFTSFQNLRGAHVSESGFLICIIVVIITGNLLEILLSFHFFIWNSCALLLICYYLYLHIQYFKYDPLTGALNRNLFAAELERLEHKGNVGVLSFDLDNLKKINDREGHEHGDAYIVSAVRLIDQCFSDVGRLYRVGGDEFVVLMINTTEETIRNKIAFFHDKCLQSAVSVSCGYAFCAAAENVAQMLRDADKAMYENKKERKARLVMQP